MNSDRSMTGEGVWNAYVTSLAVYSSNKSTLDGSKVARLRGTRSSTRYFGGFNSLNEVKESFNGQKIFSDVLILATLFYRYENISRYKRRRALIGKWFISAKSAIDSSFQTVCFYANRK